jgi:hypothetical protein
MKGKFNNVFLCVFPVLFLLYFAKFTEGIEQVQRYEPHFVQWGVAALISTIGLLYLIRILFIEKREFYSLIALVIGGILMILMAVVVWFDNSLMIIRAAKSYFLEYEQMLLPIAGMYIYSIIRYVRGKN